MDWTDNVCKLGEYDFVTLLNQLDTKTLLTCRFVNRSWRDIATSILYKREDCQIILNTKLVAPLPDRLIDPSIRIFCNDQDNAPLSELNNLLTSSRNFPSSSLRFAQKCFFEGHSQNMKVKDPEIDRFYSLYGHKIKTLSLGRNISQKYLRDLLLIHTPNVTCLDLVDFCHVRPSQNGNNNNHENSLNFFYFPRKLTSDSNRATGVNSVKDFTGLLIQTLRLGSCFNLNSETSYVFTRELLRASPNLRLIDNVSPCHLRAIIEESKTDRVRNFKLTAKDYDRNINTIKLFASLKPKLSKLTATFDDIGASCDDNSQLVTALNWIIESSKDTLNYFEINIYPSKSLTPMLIPPLQNLKCIRLTEDTPQKYFTNPRIVDCDYFSFEFKYKFKGQDYFPNLKKVELKVNKLLNGDNGNTLMTFFDFGNKNGYCDDDREFDHDYIPTVEVLDITFSSVWPTPSEAIVLSKVFPNVKRLKVKSEDGTSFDNSIWTMCPTVESIEIDGSFKTFNQANVIDSFFTGFLLDMCTRLQVTDLPKDILNSGEAMRFLRMKPSVCDLNCLRELKINFTKLFHQFGSKVTGIYAFQMMPQTKVTFLYKNYHASDVEPQLTEIAPFVQLVQMK